MRTQTILLGAACLLAGFAAHARDLGRETLRADDGWAASGSGVTGGSAAVDAQVYTVTNRAELIAALNNGVVSSTSPSNPSNEPKIIYVRGTIDANVDDANQPLSCTDYYRNGFTIEQFLATYDPAVWGRVAPSGPVEAARVASQQAQQARVRIRLGSNTTIVGLGRDATIRGAWFDIRGAAGVANSRTNIIVRNLTFRDTFDCFPAWAPTDGALARGIRSTTRSRRATPTTSGSITTRSRIATPRTRRCRCTSACCSRCTTAWSTSRTLPIW